MSEEQPATAEGEVPTSVVKQSIANSEASEHSDHGKDAIEEDDGDKQEQAMKDGTDGNDIESSMIKKEGASKHEQAMIVSSGRDKEEHRTKSFVVIVACAAALGGLIFGYGTLPWFVLAFFFFLVFHHPAVLRHI